MKKYKISFFGAGNIFFKHLKAIKKSKKFSLINIYDKNKNNNTKLIPSSSEKNILKDENVDIISVLTPSGEHFGQTKKILLSNKHAIVEKPITLKIKDIEKIVSLEKKIKKKVFVVFQHRNNPAVLKLKDLLKKKKLGKIFLISTRLYWCRNDEYYKNSWRGTWKNDGGVVTNQGIHTIDIVTSIFGQFKKIKAISNKISKFIQTEDICAIQGVMKDKIICNMEFTTAVRPKNIENSITVLGTKGSFEISGKNLNQYTNFNDQKIHKINIKNLHQKFYSEVYFSLAAGVKNKFSSISSIRSLEAIQGIYQSIKLNKEIIFPLKKKIKIKLGN